MYNKWTGVTMNNCDWREVKQQTRAVHQNTQPVRDWKGLLRVRRIPSPCRTWCPIWKICRARRRCCHEPRTAAHDVLPISPPAASPSTPSAPDRCCTVDLATSMQSSSEWQTADGRASAAEAAAAEMRLPRARRPSSPGTPDHRTRRPASASACIPHSPHSASAHRDRSRSSPRLPSTIRSPWSGIGDGGGRRTQYSW